LTIGYLGDPNMIEEHGMSEKVPEIAQVEISFPGLLTVDQINEVIKQQWRDMLSDPEGKKELEAILGVTELSADQPPVEARKANSGSLSGDILIHLAELFAVVAMERLAGKTLDVLTDNVKILWKRRLRQRVSPPASDNLGKAKKDVE
jgi:hypothetical protein